MIGETFFSRIGDDMKRRNIWGLNSIKKYLRLSTDPGKGSRFAVSDTSTLHSEDGEPVNNTDLVKMDNTTFSKKPVQLDPRISDHIEHTKVPNQPLCNPPALLPTPVENNVTSNSMQRGLLPTLGAEVSQFSNNRTSSLIYSHSNDLASSPLPTNSALDGYYRPPNTSEELMQISVAGTAPRLQNYVDTDEVVNNQQVLPLKSSLPKLTYQQLSDDWKKNKKDILDQNLHENTDDNSGCELDISPTKPMTSRYCRNLDEFLLSDSEDHQAVILSDTDIAQEFTVSSQPEVCPPQAIDTASDSNNTESNKLTDVRKNTRVPGPVIDRRKYQIGRGFDDILKIASQNVKRQRRHSLQSSESQKHDGSSHRARHRSNGTPKKKKLHESPRKLPLLVNRSLSEISVKSNHLIIAQDIQKQLDKLSMTLCVPKLDVPETVSVTEEMAVKGFCNCVRKKTERKSLFQSFSNSQHEQLITKIPEEFSLDIAERNIIEGNGDESSANDNICKVSEGVDVETGSQTSINCDLDKNRENIGLFDRLRYSVSEISPSKNSPDVRVATSSRKDNQPIKTTLKKAINFNLLKEKLSKKTFIRALEKHGVDGSSATTSSKLQTSTLPQSQDEDMMQVSASDDNHIVNNDTDINDPVFDDTACKFQSDNHDDGKEGTEHISNTEVLLNDAAALNETRSTMNDETNDDNLLIELISSDDDDDLPDLGDTVNRREHQQDSKENEVSFSQDSLEDSPLDNSITNIETKPPERKLKFTLDKMVQNKQDNDLKDVELAKITKELKKDMGIDWMNRAKSEDNANNILPDHKKELDKFAYPTDHVPGIYPGDDVFNLDHIGEVFSFPSTLRLVDCGFRPVKGKATDSLLWKASPDDLVGLINSCLLAEAHLVRPCQDALMVWIFYLMSIHGSIHTIMQAFKTLWSLMNNSIRFNQSRVWLPSLKQITRVLLNYGATFESLFPSTELEPAFSLNDVLNESGKDKENMVEDETESTLKNQSWTSQKQFPVDALNHVIKLITHGMHLRDMHKQPVFYSEEELKQLIGLICRSGLETQGKEDTHGEDFALCTAALLEGFSITSWSMKSKELCEALPALTSHHHNLVHLVELFPTFTDRGRQTRRLLRYVTCFL
ncbi:uncharacterized protein LOC117110988 [Anneissia japonica]|uniref:uncharacterized protein LOC117110988 n=1 Tax=Anneissia japonica TaxID=1529436 RepID=UPI0014257EE0|nr:uncharacterized protein LOC117110988 [Anneissia japonica]